MTSEPDRDLLDEAKTLLAGCLFVPVERIGDDTHFAEAGPVDSLNFALIALEIERRIGHDLDPLRLLEMRSARDVALILAEG